MGRLRPRATDPSLMQQLSQAREALQACVEYLSWFGPPKLKQLPLDGGGHLTVNPPFVMAVQAVSESACRVTVAGVGHVNVALSQVEVEMLLIEGA